MWGIRHDPPHLFRGLDVSQRVAEREGKRYSQHEIAESHLRLSENKIAASFFDSDRSNQGKLLQVVRLVLTEDEKMKKRAEK